MSKLPDPPPSGSPETLDGGEVQDAPRGGGVAAYVAAVAAGRPTPGGGSVVAVVAALGAALAEMVGNLTLGRSGASEAEGELRPALERAAALRTRLLALAAADETAYGRYATASVLPRVTEADKTRRRAAMQEALVGAAEVPLAVVEACVEMADGLERIARLGNKQVLADAAIGAHLGRAALRGALLNVRGNARLMADAGLAATFLHRADEAEVRGEAAVERVFQTLAGRGA